MTHKEFKAMFGEIATASGLKHAFGGWIKEMSECLAVLELQKSNFGEYFELNIKLFIVGLFGKTPVLGKPLVTKESGNIFRRPPSQYKDIFNLGVTMPDEDRRKRLQIFFEEFMIPFLEKASTRGGILGLEKNGEIFVLPAVKMEFVKGFTSAQ